MIKGIAISVNKNIRTFHYHPEHYHRLLLENYVRDYGDSLSTIEAFTMGANMYVVFGYLSGSDLNQFRLGMHCYGDILIVAIRLLDDAPTDIYLPDINEHYNEQLCDNLSPINEGVEMDVDDYLDYIDYGDSDSGLTSENPIDY